MFQASSSYFPQTYQLFSNFSHLYTKKPLLIIFSNLFFHHCQFLLQKMIHHLSLNHRQIEFILFSIRLSPSNMLLSIFCYQKKLFSTFSKKVSCYCKINLMFDLNLKILVGFLDAFSEKLLKLSVFNCPQFPSLFNHSLNFS